MDLYDLPAVLRDQDPAVLFIVFLQFFSKTVRSITSSSAINIFIILHFPLRYGNCDKYLCPFAGLALYLQGVFSVQSIQPLIQISDTDSDADIGRLAL